MPRCPYCLSPNPANSSICYSCGRVVLGTRGMTSRLGPPRPGGELIHRARRGPPPGMNVRRVGTKASGRRDRKSKSNIRTMVLVVAIAFLFLFTPAQERISNQLEKWLDSLLEEFGPASRVYQLGGAWVFRWRVRSSTAVT